MIERYTREEMGRHWSLQNRYQTWLEVEFAHLEACGQTGLIPQEAAALIRKKAAFQVERIEELEKTLKHDVIAFLTNVGEGLGEEKRYLHYGLTSSDVLDTSLALLLVRASERIEKGLQDLCRALKDQALRHKDTLQIGRSHGIHAEPITFGLKLALYYAEMKRNVRRLENARASIAVGKFSGAVGTYAHLSPEVEEIALKKLGLKPEPIATQVIQRDRHAEFFTTLAILGGSMEKIAVEIRHLQRTEVREVEESFSSGQKGSSAMPHKRNPISAENLTGCARLLRSYAQAALENIALWHERDISHSSVERVIAPDATILADYMIHRLTGVIRDLAVYPETMKANLEKSYGLIFSQALLLKLIMAGLNREQAYALVQKNALKIWDEGGDFQKRLLEDAEIGRYLKPQEIRALFDVNQYIKYRDQMFQRILEKD